MFLDIFELHYRIGNICKLPRMRKARVTIAGPFHKVRSFVICPALEPTIARTSLRLPGLKRRRESFHEEMLRVAGMTWRSSPLARTRRLAAAAAINKAIRGTKVDSCRNDRPDSSQRQIKGTKIPGSPYFDGGRVRQRARISRQGPSRGEAPICSDDTAVPWMFEAGIVVEL